MQRAEIVIPKDKLKPLVVGDKFFRSIYDFQVTEADLKKAYLELGETESLRNKSIEVLKERLSVDADAFSDMFLLSYLRYSKFNVEKAYRMVRKLSEKRIEHEELYRFSPKLERLLDSNFVKYIPYRDEEGSPVHWIHFKRLDIDEMTPNDVLNLVNIIGDLYSMTPSYQINSVLSVWDMEGITLRHISLILSISVMKLMLKFLLDTYPWRIKRIILFNCNQVIKTFYNTFRFLLKKKIADRVVFFGSDLSELHKYLHPALYPREYGGNIEDQECNMKDFIMMNVPFIKYQRSIKLAD